MPTIKEISSVIKESIGPLVGDNEARHFAWLLLDYLRGYTRTDLILKGDETLKPDEVAFVTGALERLSSGEPIQYVLGQTEFLGLTFKVDVRVLIPRPETEELVEWILSDVENDKVAILDIGTGSGCIPITLKNNLPNASIEAWDVSVDALNLARENALRNKTSVEFKCVDVLDPTVETTMTFDVVVSNPPYVLTEEKLQMAVNVLNYEPHLALFVENHEPLVFYNAIATLSKSILKPGGKLYFEINRAFGNDVVEMLLSQGYDAVVLRKDLSGNDRMVRAVWPGAH
jgi:release factor glutamine methyltransferase